jgi:rubrerythrin
MLPNARLGVLLLPVGLLVAPNALAAGGSVNPGILVSGVVGDNSAFGLGGELSFMVFPEHRVITEQIGFGAFAQAQSYNFEQGRYALGLQFGSAIGGEVGWAYREATSTLNSSQGLHLAVFLSAGVAALSLRSTIPVQTSERPLHEDPGFEFAFCLALKFPLNVGDVEFMRPMQMGRPLREGERLLLPQLFQMPSARAKAPLGPRALRWGEDARAEYASVPAFLRLACELQAHGAHSLAARARAAAREELRHARACLAVAQGESGARLALGPVPEPAPRFADLETLARESVVEGCVGEALAGNDARTRLQHERAPLARRALALIARDEQRHAELAHDVVKFCVARGGQSVRRAALDAAESQRLRLSL